MIAADTSVWSDFFKARPSRVARRLEELLAEEHVVLPMPVLFELLSGPGLDRAGAKLIERMPQLELRDLFWERTAEMRKKILSRGLKARSLDCLIAQNCIDHGVPLLAADSDYRHFVRYGLKLA